MRNPQAHDHSCGAGQVIQRLEVRTQHPKARIVRIGRIILQGVPEGMKTPESLAGDTLPVCLGIVRTGACEAVLGSGDGPSGFGDPDPDAGFHAADGVAGLLEVLAEGVEALIGADAFPVRVPVSFG